jgi:lipid-A-disaccharide synthase-like uncharacterized protein
LQWWISERRGVATLDTAFWLVSLAGSALLLVYALWHQDWVMVLAFGPGPLIYVRNLVLIRRAGCRVPVPGLPADATALASSPQSSPRAAG